MRLLRCFSLAFDNSKTRFEKKICFKIKFSNKRKTSTKRRTFFLYKLNQKVFMHMEAHKKWDSYVAFRQLSDPIAKKRRLKLKFSNKRKTSAKRRTFFLYKLNQKVFMHLDAHKKWDSYVAFRKFSTTLRPDCKKRR